MKKTKIICSMGPASMDPKTLEEMSIHGMNVARINFSHGDYAEYDEMLDSIYKVRNETGKQVGILWDTKGPEFRTLEMKHSYELKEGDHIQIVKKEVIGDSKRFSVNHPKALDNIEKDSIILIDNAKIKMIVTEKNDDYLDCEVISGGTISSHKSISVPGVQLNLPYVSKEDKKDIEYACRNDGEFLALSFVSSKDDVLAIRKIIKEYDREDLKIISKIENKLAIDNIDEILDVSDGIMVARGDLGTEIESEKLPIIQKQIIKKARKKGKISIVATEMLESMMEDARPKRAETSDIANAVLDGTDAVMLSGETTIGQHPINTCSAMGKICEVTEEYATFDYINEDEPVEDVSKAIADAVVNTSNRIGAKLICASTISGETAAEISNLKPDAFILALCPNEKICRMLSLNYGVYTKIIPFYNSTDEILLKSVEMGTEFMKLKTDDILITTGSFPNTGESSPTNLMKIEKID